MVRSTALLGILLATAWAPPDWAGSSTNKGANPNGEPFVEFQGQIIEVEGSLK